MNESEDKHHTLHFTPCWRWITTTSKTSTPGWLSGLISGCHHSRSVPDGRPACSQTLIIYGFTEPLVQVQLQLSLQFRFDWMQSSGNQKNNPDSAGAGDHPSQTIAQTLRTFPHGVLMPTLTSLSISLQTPLQSLAVSGKSSADQPNMVRMAATNFRWIATPRRQQEQQ